jgi:hypothetical protein
VFTRCKLKACVFLLGRVFPTFSGGSQRGVGESERGGWHTEALEGIGKDERGPWCGCLGTEREERPKEVRGGCASSL